MHWVLAGHWYQWEEEEVFPSAGKHARTSRDFSPLFGGTNDVPFIWVHLNNSWGLLNCWYKCPQTMIFSVLFPWHPLSKTSICSCLGTYHLHHWHFQREISSQTWGISAEQTCSGETRDQAMATGIWRWKRPVNENRLGRENYRSMVRYMLLRKLECG